MIIRYFVHKSYIFLLSNMYIQCPSTSTLAPPVEKQYNHDEDRQQAEAEDASLWAHFDDWVWDDVLLEQLP